MKKIAFYNEKEGVGKTTLSLLIPIILKNKFHIEAVVVETGANKISEKRNKEIAKLKNIPMWQDKMKQNIEICNVSTWEEYEKIEPTFLEEKELILFDLQEINEDQIQFLLHSEFVFIISDTNPSEKEYQLNEELYLTFQNIRYSSVPLKKVYMIFNMVDEKFELTNQEIDVVFPIIGKKEAYKEQNISTLAFPVRGDMNTLAEELYKVVMLETQQYYL